MGLRHHDPGHGQGADEVEGIDVLLLGQRGALDLDQHVDRYRLRVFRQVGQLDQQAGAVGQRLAHAEDAAGADLHPCLAHVGQGLQALAVGAGGDDVAVELRRGVEVVVVVVQPGLGQGLGLLLGQLAEGHAGFQAELLHALHHFQHVGHVLGRGVLPGGAHAEAGGADGLGLGGRFQHLLHFHQLLLVQAGVVVAGLRAVLAVFRAGAGLDRQQGRDLHAVRVEVRAVHRLRLEQEVVEGLLEERLHFGEGPVVAGGDGCGCTHGEFLRTRADASLFSAATAGRGGSGFGGMICKPWALSTKSKSQVDK